jgi:hypothetical protein
MTSAAPITRDDIEAKFREIQGEVDEAGATAKNYVLVAGVVVGLAVAAAAFYFGRRRGRLQKTIVEIRRV